MKQSGKIFGNIGKNHPNLKDRDPNGVRKIIESKETQSDRSEAVSGPNSDELKNSGFSRPKANPPIIPTTAYGNSSWFTKVNQIHANGNPKIHNKENQGTNKSLGEEDDNLGDQGHTGGAENPTTKSSIEKRIARFMVNLSKKLKSYVKDNQDGIDNSRETKRKFEEYIRSLSPEELDKFLCEHEQEYPDQSVSSEKSEWADLKQGELEEVKSVSAISEIPQEEIILMTNLGSTISTQTTAATIKTAFGEYTRLHFLCFE